MNDMSPMKVLPSFGLGTTVLAVLGTYQPPATEALKNPGYFSNAFLFPGYKMVVTLPLPTKTSLRSNGNNNQLFYSLSLKNWGQRNAEVEKIDAFEKKIGNNEKEKVRIGIVGGGICGNSVAAMLAKKLKSGGHETKKKDYEIVVLEGDPHSAVTSSLSTIETLGERQLQSPKWSAATAKNANSIVPAAAMHVFSRKEVLLQVLRDTVTEWYVLKKEYIYKNLFPKNLFIRRQDDFDFTPPYFAMHLWKCLGPAASSEERWSFVRFLKHFLYTTIVLGEAEANRRGHYMCELAKANRHIFLQEVAAMNKKRHDLKYAEGFLGCYRSLDSAKHNVEDALEHGEEAHLLEWEEAIKKEPKLANLPFKPLYVVHRPNDIISSCEEFNRAWTEEMRDLGVLFRGLSQVEKIEPLKKKEDESNKTGYRIHLKDGGQHDFDVVVLAAGVHTPILASKLGAQEFVPTYPLRGYSLTNFIKPPEKQRDAPKENLLRTAFSVDSMYCTSVSPYMARIAGFGEFVGFPGKGDNVPSIAPFVMSRYTKIIFKQGINGEPDVALRCYRATSPDDLPIVGAIPTHPNLYIHTGHGTLGWTTGLATGECLAQTIYESLENEQEKQAGNMQDQKKYYEFPTGIKIERAVLSPSRFYPNK